MVTARLTKTRHGSWRSKIRISKRHTVRTASRSRRFHWRLRCWCKRLALSTRCLCCQGELKVIIAGLGKLIKNFFFVFNAINHPGRRYTSHWCCPRLSWLPPSCSYPSLRVSQAWVELNSIDADMEPENLFYLPLSLLSGAEIEVKLKIINERLMTLERKSINFPTKRTRKLVFAAE